MKKKIINLLVICWILFFWWNNVFKVFADDISLISISDPVFILHKIWTDMWTWYLNNQTIYYEDWWYFVRQNWQTYDYAWISQWTLMPWIPPTYNSNTMITIETERFQYFLWNNQSWLNYDTWTEFVNIYDKIEDNFYSQTYWYSNWIDWTPYYFFLNWEVIWKFMWDSVRYHLDRDVEWVVLWVDVFDYTNLIYPWQSQVLYINQEWKKTRLNYTASENWNTLYYVSWTNLIAQQFVNDPDIWLIRNTTTLAIPSTPTNFSATIYNQAYISNYYVILANGWIYVSMAYNYDFLTLFYDLWTQEFLNIWDVYMYHYNHYVWHGWYTDETKAQDEQLLFEAFWPLKVWKYSTIDEVYKKFYVKTDNILYTNSTDFFWEDELSWSWTIEDPTWETPTEDPVWDLTWDLPSTDTTSWIDFLTNPIDSIWWLFGWVWDTMDEAKEWKEWLENWTKDMINSLEDFWSWETDTKINYDTWIVLDPQLQWIIDNMSKMDTWKNDFLSALYYMLKIFIIWVLVLILIAFIIFYYANN